MRFFKPAWMSDNVDKASKSVKEEDNQVKLFEIAKNALRCEIRWEATDKLTDPALAQQIYTDLAKNAPNPLVRFKTAEKLTDKKLAQQILY